MREHPVCGEGMSACYHVLSVGVKADRDDYLAIMRSAGYMMSCVGKVDRARVIKTDQDLMQKYIYIPKPCNITCLYGWM